MVKKQGWTTVQGKRRKTLTPDQCTPVEKPGKHRYLMPLDTDMRARIMPFAKPYPKRAKQAMTDDQSAQRQGSTDPHAPNQEASNA